MKPFVLTPSAQQDLNNIARDNLKAADRVLAALHTAVLKLAKNSAVSHWREELADKRNRVFSVYSYLIVYREAKPLQIIRALHVGRDVQIILAPHARPAILIPSALP